jgi:2-dehydropantoate 2-reductase
MSRVVIVGPGGLGSTIAALLAHKTFCEVKIAGRPGAHIEEIRKNGLRLCGLDECTVQIDATDDPSSIQDCDFLIYLMKAQDTRAALDQTKHIQVHSAAVSLQNGVIKDDLLVETFGRDKVIGGLAIAAGERPEPGVAKWTYDGITQFGEFDGTPSVRVDKIVDLFQQAGFNTEASDAVLSSTWTKMVAWVPLGLIACLAHTNNAATLADEQLTPTYMGLVREFSTLAAARGVPLTDIGPYHVKTWCQGSIEEAIKVVMQSPLASSQSMHSGLQDILKGRPTEFAACVGPMIQEAADRGISIPAVQLLYSVLMGLEKSLNPA